jgi:NADPH-dependent 2,4-dienoyl-CoA reductase/sulfur reductase-like enzyme/rhodanese-related sulfurtransferase
MEDNMPRYIIIGGVAGGMSAATRLRRLEEKAEIIVFERGEYVSYANCGLPYYIGGAITDKSALTLQTPASLKTRFNIDVRVFSEAVSIDAKSKKVQVRDLKTGNEYSESYDKLVLSPGAEPSRLAIPGMESPKIFTLRTVPDTYRISEFIEHEKPGSAVVIGGGYIGIEMAENLREKGIDVTLIEALPQILNILDPEMSAIIEADMRKKGIKIITGQSAVSFKDYGKILELALSGGERIEAGMAILSIGVTPDLRLAKEAGLQSGKGIMVNEFMQTSDPDIYAVGDAVEIYNPVLKKSAVIPLAGPASKQGRMVADNIVYGNIKKYPGTLGASVLKVFGLSVASVGAAAKALEQENISYETVVVHPASHASYYPGAVLMTLKLLFSPADGSILGAQAIGADMVEKKIDVISALMQKQGTIYDLAAFEQCYAPPYNSAKDAVNMAGFVAENILSGKIKSIMWEKLLKARDSYTVIDARTPREFAMGSAKGAINIPVDNMRAKLENVPKEKKIAVYCGVGIRSYIAVRILMQNGFDEVYNISGGFTSYGYAKKMWS